MAWLRKKAPPAIRSPRFTDQNESLAFRRSRTLTGSAASDVRAAGETSARLSSPRLKEHELRTHRRRLGGYLFSVVLAIACLVMLLNQFIGIVHMSVTSRAPLTTSPQLGQYQSLLDEYFGTHPIERFRFMLNETQLTNFMVQRAPEVQRIDVTSTGFVTADADVTFREPVVAWQLGSQRSYVDSEGHAYKRNYYGEPSVTVKDQSGIDPSAGAIVSDRFLRVMGRVIALTNAAGLKVSGVVIPPQTSREIDFTLEGRGYAIKTLLDRDPAATAMDIINGVKYLDSKAIKPSYVDVRIASKLVYK